MDSLKNIISYTGTLTPNQTMSSIINLVGKSIEIIMSGLYTIEGKENIPRDKNFLLIANHPTNFDYFIIKQALESNMDNTHFLVHKNLIQHPLTKEYSKKHNFLGVRRVKNGTQEENQSMLPHNLNSIKQSVQLLGEDKNIGIFIAGEGYIKDMEEIYHGYRLIVKQYLKNNESITVLPITLQGKKLRILPPTQLSNYSQEELQNIEDSMKSSIQSIK